MPNTVTLTIKEAYKIIAGKWDLDNNKWNSKHEFIFKENGSFFYKVNDIIKLESKKYTIEKVKNTLFINGLNIQNENALEIISISPKLIVLKGKRKIYTLINNTTINERINTIITREGLNQNSFSVHIGHHFQRTRHILIGRNKPSYDYLVSVIKAFPHIRVEWIMLGTGSYNKHI